MESYTIRETNEIVQVGDCVLMRSSNEKAPHVGRVKKFEVDHKKGTEVRVRWYYRPEEVDGGRRPFHGEKELFLSGHYDYQRADCIEGKCTVHKFKNYTKLKDIQPKDYYCRLEYNASTRKFMPNNIPVYCKCETPRNPNQLMVKCEGCKDRFHPACVGMTTEQAELINYYMCSDCEPKDTIRNPSSAFSNDTESNEPSKVESRLSKTGSNSSKVESKKLSKEKDWAHKVVKMHVAEKSVIGKRSRAMFEGAVNAGGCRRDEQVSLDNDKDSNPSVKRLQGEVKELSKLVAEMCEYVGFSRHSQAPNK